MKTKELFSTNSMAIIVLASLAIFDFTACSGDDEPSIDELLSEKTTPVTFEIGRSGDFLFFDYAGKNYIGSDTIHHIYFSSSSPKTTELNLRQGKHHLIWLKFSDEASEIPMFSPTNKTISTSNPEYMSYAEYDYEVMDYITPAHKPNFIPLTARCKDYCYRLF